MSDPYLVAIVYFVGDLPIEKRYERPISCSYCNFLLCGRPSQNLKDMSDPYLVAYFCFFVGDLPIEKDMSDPYLVATVLFFFVGDLPKIKRYERPISSSLLYVFCGRPSHRKDMRDPYLVATVLFFALWETFPK